MTQPIQMVDLVGQYHDLQPELDAAIRGVLEHGQYIGGKEVEMLETELVSYTRAQACITCANGTDALLLALMALDIHVGDEVIVPDFTFAAPAEATALLGATPVFADVRGDTMLIDPDDVTRKITGRTRAIIAVHLFGQCAEMEALEAIANQHGLQLIEDGAQALGAEYTYSNGQTKQATTMGAIGCTSFFPTKNLGCYGDGGAVFTRDPLLAEKIRCLAHHGMKRKYHHELVGINSRLDALQAAILRVKLRHLDEHIAARQRAAARYDSLLANIPGITLPARAEHSTHTYHQYVIQLPNRDEVRQRLSEQGVPTMVYYPESLHTQPAYKNETLRYENEDIWKSDKLCQHVLALPIHTQITEQEQTRIACLLSELTKD